VEKATRESLRDKQIGTMGAPIIGISDSIQRIKELVSHVAHTGLNTVISGESGVGKEVVAQSLYQKSPRLGNRS
jgi:two-component system response regulator AtoC